MVDADQFSAWTGDHACKTCSCSAPAVWQPTPPAHQQMERHLWLCEVCVRVNNHYVLKILQQRIHLRDLQTSASCVIIRALSFLTLPPVSAARLQASLHIIAESMLSAAPDAALQS